MLCAVFAVLLLYLTGVTDANQRESVCEGYRLYLSICTAFFYNAR